MKKILYLECASGISGDMTVATLLDLGADETYLRHQLNSLDLTGYTIDIYDVMRNSIRAKKFDVLLSDEPGHAVHTHLHTHSDHHDHSHHHEHNHGHAHKHNNGHAHHHDEQDHEVVLSGNHEHRNLAAVTKILKSGSLDERELSLALKIFTILAEAEAKAHNCAVEEVHFHEVGAVDSIIDIAAAAICFCNLEIDEVVVTGLSEGTGFVQSQHGLLPIPVPAVLHIAQTHQLPLRILPEIEGELITPTGAAIVAALRTQTVLPAELNIIQTGYGAGTKEFTIPNILRSVIFC